MKNIMLVSLLLLICPLAFAGGFERFKELPTVMADGSTTTGVTNPLWPIYAAVSIAQATGKEENRNFWAGLLEEDLTTTSAAGKLAISIYIGQNLSQMGPRPCVMRISKLLLKDGSGWSDIGIPSISDESIGNPVTLPMKRELQRVFVNYSNQYLRGYKASMVIDQ